MTVPRPRTRIRVPPIRSTNSPARPLTVTCRPYWTVLVAVVAAVAEEVAAEMASKDPKDGDGCWTCRRYRTGRPPDRRSHNSRQTGTRVVPAPPTFTNLKYWAAWAATRPNFRWPTTTTVSAGTRPTSSVRWTGSRWSSPSGWSTKCCSWARWACWT